MKDYAANQYGLIPNLEADQTQALQRVLDLCRGGGRAIIPRGTYKISSVRLWSDTELHLEAGARLEGSARCSDYALFDLPEGFRLYTDQQAFRHLLPAGQEPYPYYRRAMISAYGERNIAVTGERDSVIDGMDCYDPDGEEHFRGPHAIFLSGCEGVTLRGYTVQNAGNFQHQLDNCENVTMERVTALAGHDGIHLHRCRRLRIADCLFRTGDDCIAGCDVSDLTVTRCELNTSCNVFRLGGSDIRLEGLRVTGPGYYPHLLSVVHGPQRSFRRTDGRHNTLFFLEYFASPAFANLVPAHNILVRDCQVSGVDAILHYHYGDERALHAGMELGEIAFEDDAFLDLARPSPVQGNPASPTRVRFSRVTATYRDGQPRPLVEGSAVEVTRD